MSSVDPFNQTALEASASVLIVELLAADVCPAYTMNIDQLGGYLRAVAVEPQATTPNDWMPLVFGGEIPSFIEGYEVDTITNALICLYNSHRAQVLNELCALSFPYAYTHHRVERIQAEQWARGFMQGYIFWQDIWSQFLAENQTGLNLAVILPISVNDEIDDILATISAVADAEYAQQAGVSVDELIRMFNRLPQKVIEYGRLAHIIRSSNHAVAGERVVAVL